MRNAYVIRTNSGQHRSGFFLYLVSQVACIKKLPDTLASRSLHIPLQKRRDGEKISQSFRDADPEKFKRLCRQAFRWAKDNGEAVRYEAAG